MTMNPLGSTSSAVHPVGGDDPEEGNATDEPTVLVVDDEITLREVTKRILTRFGFSVLTAKDGFEAIELYGAHHDAIALVLIDMSMPRMNGEETLRELRRIDKNVIAVLSSGFGAPQTIGGVPNEGATEFIRKPYEADQLVALIHSLLGAR